MADRVVSYDFRGNFTNLTAGLAVASKSVGDFGGKLTALDKNGAKMRAGLDTLGRTAGRIGLVAAAGLGAAVLASANFDQAMSNVQAATHETADNMDLLRKAALKAGADTAFSATEAAAGIEELAKAGISTADILAGGLSGALDLAAAGGLDVAQAAEISATALTQFKLEGEDVAHVADLLAAGAGKAQGSVADMGMALKQSGLVAAQTGLTVEETTGTLAAFASAGLVGSDAGTSFKTMLQSLTPTTTKAKSLMQELGISAYDASGNFVGMTEFAGSLQEGLAGLSVEQQNAAMKTIFGSDAVRAASVVFEQGADGIQEWTDKVNDSGYAAETAATRLDNLKGDLEALRGSLETAFIGAGDGTQGPLRSMVQGLTDAINAFNDLPPAAKNAASGLLGITAILGGGLWFGSKVVGGIVNAKQALSDLGFSAGKTQGSLRRMTLTAGGLLTLAAAVTAVGNAVAEASGAKLDLSDLERDLEALSDGRGGLLDRVTNDLEIVNQLSGELTEPLKEAVTLFGLFGNTNLDNAKENLSQVDASLASMVESGNGDKAAEIFERIREASDLDDAEVTEYFDSYQTALGNAGGATSIFIPEAVKARLALKNLGQETDQASNAGARMARMTAAQAKALEESRKSARESAQGFVNLGDKLDDAKTSLGDWLRQLEKQASALRDFRLNAEKAAKQGLDEGLIAALHRMGPAGALRMRQLANATDEQIARANSAWKRGQAEIERYVDEVGGVAKGLRDINSIKLNDKSFTIHVNRTGAGLDFLSGGARQKADGGYIAGPGTGTSDSIPARLSNGEYVIKASAVAKYGIAMFDSLNAQRFASGGPVGFANGGQARTGDAQIGTAAQAAARSMWDLSDKTRAQLREMDKELAARQKLLDRELAHAQKRMQAELDELKALKDARRDLAQATASGFMSDIFGEGATFTSMLSTLAGDSANAAQFEDALAQLSALGLNGGAFAGLAASGNLSAAQDLLAAAFANPQMIAVFEQAFANRALAAQSAGQYAGDESLGQAIREQAKEARASRVAVERLEAETKLLRHEVRQVEKAAAQKGPDRVVRGINNAAGSAARRR